MRDADGGVGETPVVALPKVVLACEFLFPRSVVPAPPALVVHHSEIDWTVARRVGGRGLIEVGVACATGVEIEVAALFAWEGRLLACGR